MSLVITQTGGNYEPCFICDKCLEVIKPHDAGHVTMPALDSGQSSSQYQFYHDQCDRTKQGWKDLAGLDMHTIELDWFARQMGMARGI